jgi:hypothetical protein
VVVVVVVAEMGCSLIDWGPVNSGDALDVVGIALLLDDDKGEEHEKGCLVL